MKATALVPCPICGTPFKLLAQKYACSKPCRRELRAQKVRRTVSIRSADRFWSRVEKTPTCWLWRGTMSHGYGCIRVDGRLQPAHRLSYEWMVAPIPQGEVIDHICRVTICVRPEHLRSVTPGENVMAPGSLSMSKRNSEKTECVNGHPYTPENTYRIPKTGTRLCRTCMREQRQKRKRAA